MPPVELWSFKIDGIRFGNGSFQGRTAAFDNLDVKIIDRKVVAGMVVRSMFGKGTNFIPRV